jgi:hypothetical protein
MITIRCEELQDTAPLKWATLENDVAMVERIDDCRCKVLVKRSIGVEELRHVAKFLYIAADYFDAEQKIPWRSHEPVKVECPF